MKSLHSALRLRLSASTRYYTPTSSSFVSPYGVLRSVLRLRLSAAKSRLVTGPAEQASYHIYSGTECEARSIIFILVTKA